jgi:hypothetical protein
VKPDLRPRRFLHTKASVPFVIRYAVPTDGLTATIVDGKHQIVLGVAAMALNSEGAEHQAEQMAVTLPEDVPRCAPGLAVTVG